MGSVYKVVESKDFGRYLVATKDIPEDTLILQEAPILFSPSDEYEESESDEIKKSTLFCLNCCLYLKNSSHSGFDHCAKCGWPLCKNCTSHLDNNTPDRKVLHSSYECVQFAREGVAFPPPHQWPVLFKSVLIYRLHLLVKTKSPDIWPTCLEKLEHHNEDRAKKDHCVASDRNILENLRYFCKNDQHLDEGLIQRLIGIVNVNGFGTSKGTLEKGNWRKAKSLFRQGSLFAHSCRPNCSWNITLDKGSPEITVLTAVPIKEGGALTIAYNTHHLFYGTLKRQISMESLAHFYCRCERCMDPTELGTFMSSLRCFKCEASFLIPSTPLLHDADWTCSDCGGNEPVSKIVLFVTDIEDVIDKIEGAKLERGREIDLLQTLFEKHYEKLLHKNHYTLQEISTKIVELLAEEGLERKTMRTVERFLWHIDYLKAIADVILPGRNKYQEQLAEYKEEGLYHYNQNHKN